jgi:uncharacterized membrane protein YkoI
MRPSKVMLASIFITAAILVVIGGITTLAFANKTADSAASASAGQEAGLMDQQREAAYNQLIEQANQQLDQANQQLQALQSQVEQLKQNDPAQSQPAVSVSADQASDIARQVAGKGRITVSTPELVSFEGKTAYEVVFNQGSIYVDAQSGAVLFNGTVPQTITADKAVEVASAYLHLNDILQVDQVTIGNQERYRITFADGTMCWVDLTGQIIDIQYKVRASSGDQPSSSSGGGSPPTSYSHDDDHEHGSDD